MSAFNPSACRISLNSFSAINLSKFSASAASKTARLRSSARICVLGSKNSLRAPQISLKNLSVSTASPLVKFAPARSLSGRNLA